MQNDAIIEYYAAPILKGARLDARNGAEATRYAIGRTLDMTRMPDGPSEPGVMRQENGILLQVERWQSWIIERPFCDLPGTLEWVKG